MKNNENKVNQEVKSLAVIGCGASTVLILEAIKVRIKEIIGKIDIHVFEKNSYIARGMAYSTKIDSLIINTAPETMSVNEVNSDEFTNWLHDKKIKKMNGISRWLYGDYLEEKLKTCINTINKNDNKITIHKEKVNKILVSRKYTVITANQTKYFDYCIIATGAKVNNPTNLKNSDMLTIFDELKISKIKNNKRICILGSGQSAIDACILLEHFNIHGYYTLLSRNGILPGVKSDLYINKNSITHGLCCRYLSFVELTNIIKEAIFKKTKKRRHTITPLESLQIMNNDIINADINNYPSWQRAMVELTPHINKSWQKMSKREKKIFYARYYHIFHYLRSAITPPNAKRFLKIIEDGRIELIWGEYLIKKERELFSIAKIDSILNFDHVINTTGLKPDNLQLMLADEVNSGELNLNEMGGINVDYNNMRVLKSNGLPYDGLYSIGYPTYNSIIIPNSIELLHECAKSLVINLIQSIKEKKNESYICRGQKH